jgi:hypothetical protein
MFSVSAQKMKPLYDQFSRSWGYVSEKGMWMINPAFEAAEDFSDGNVVAAVMLNKRWGAINSKGTVVVEPIFEFSSQAVEAYFQQLESKDQNSEWILVVKDIESGKFGFANCKGAWVIKPQYDVATDFTDCFRNAEITSSVAYPIDYYSNKPVDYLDNMFYGLANVVSFTRCFYYAKLHGGFIEGTSTLSAAILGENFFGGCVLAESFERCFEKSTGIKFVSEKLFDDCTHAKKFLSAFFDCAGIEGNVPELWERDDVETFAGCYEGCTNAQNYADIPEAWK